MVPGPGDGVWSVLGILLLGLFLGLRHALDVDHLAAVWAIASEHPAPAEAAQVGLLWGVGHTAALLGAGVLVVLIGLQIPPAVAEVLEAAVAAVLVVLGARVLLQVARGRHLHAHPHRHGARIHVHPHFHDVPHDPSPDGREGEHHGGGIRARPLLVGFLHGGAGSAALMLMLLPAIASPSLAFAYIGIFGLGSIGGMLAMSLLVSLPLRLAACRQERVLAGTRLAAGGFSVAVGLLMAWEIGLHRIG